MADVVDSKLKVAHCQKLADRGRRGQSDLPLKVSKVEIYKDWKRHYLSVNSSMINTSIFFLDLLEKVPDCTRHWATSEAYRLISRWKTY